MHIVFSTSIFGPLYKEIILTKNNVLKTKTCYYRWGGKLGGRSKNLLFVPLDCGTIGLNHGGS